MSHLTKRNTALTILAAAALIVGSAAALNAAPAPVQPYAQSPAARRSTITGTVNGPDNKPVANARVILIRAGEHQHNGPATRPAGGPGSHAGGSGARGGARNLHPVGETQTDSSGHFTFNNIPPGNYGVVAGLRGVGRAHERVTVADGTVPNVTLTLAPAQNRAGGPTTRPSK